MLFYDEKQLIEMIEAFYLLSGIRAGLYYLNGQNFYTYPDKDLSPFCRIARSNPLINSKCINCDLLHMEECKNKNTPIVYNCHLGLTEVIAPIKEDNVIICYFMFGQFLIDEEKEKSRMAILNNLKEYGIDDNTLKDAIEKIPCLNSARLKALVKIFGAIVSQIILSKMIDYSEIKFLNNLNLYIDAHLSENIHIKDIYEYLNISRSFLYMYSKKYLDCSISTYILNRKINHARHMLRNTGIKIKDIPKNIGFSDYNYFARVFKKLTGISPRAYKHSRENWTISNMD